MSAITLGGVQMNLAGIVGPALGGFLLPIVGPAMLFSLNALAFLSVALVIARCYGDRRQPKPHLENFLESFASAARYVRYAPGMQVILTRNFLFSLFIAVIPALVPVVALHHLRLQVSQLGLVFTSMGIGSLLSVSSRVRQSSRNVRLAGLGCPAACGVETYSLPGRTPLTNCAGAPLWERKWT